MTDVFGDKLIFWTPQFTEVLYDDHLTFSLSDLAGGMISGNAIDRTGMFDEKVVSEIISPVPSVENVKNKEFSDICLEQANEILLRDLPINIYWSGGIDSTVLLIALVQVASDINRTDQLSVRLQPDAIDEYPLFYEKYIKKMNYKILDNISFRRDVNFDDQIVVTGECGDQLFGHTILMSFFDEKDLPWETIFDDNKYFTYRTHRPPWLKTAAKELMTSKKLREFYREKLKVHIKSCPFEIVTIFDLYWWCNFIFKWNGALFEMFNYDLTFNKEHFKNDYPFFKSVDFQIWSLLNHDKKIRGEFKTYKYIMKDFIYEFTKDADYRDNKEKERSGGKQFDSIVNTYQKRAELTRTNQTIMAIDDKFNPICMYDIFTHNDEISRKFKVDLNNDNFFKL